MPEKLVIIGSGPASWTAAIYAARANLEPVVYEGAISEENRLRGTLPLGQLMLTTEVENFPGFPEGIMGPELMERFKKQAARFGAQFAPGIATKVNLKKRPFEITYMSFDTGEHTTIHSRTLIVATGASAKYLGIP